MAKLSYIFLGIPFAVAGAAVAVPAAADENERRVEVRYDDLNLASVSGRERLATRVSVAVRNVCGGNVGRVTLREQAAIRQCEADAMGRAQTRMAALIGGHGAQFADQGRQPLAAKD